MRHFSIVALITAIMTTAVPHINGAAAIHAQNPNDSAKLIVILVDSLDPEEVAADPVWGTITGRSAFGLMNTRVGGRSTPASTHLTIGTGVRADAPTDAARAYAADELLHDLTAGATYFGLTGIKAPHGSIVALELGRLLRFNNSDRTNAPVGWLGDQLQAAGVSPVLIGNSDTITELRRFGVLTMMNSSGIVPHGEVGRQVLRSDPGFPFGLRTDYEAIARMLSQNAQAGLLVVELGDLARLDAYQDSMTTAAWIRQRHNTVHEIGEFVSQLLTTPDMANRTMLILCPTPRIDRIAAGQWLSPAWLLGPGISPALLRTQGTRRPGIMLSTEMAAAILALGTQGTPGTLRTTPHPDPHTYVMRQFRQILALHSFRAPVLRTYVIISIGVFLAAWLVIWAALSKRLRHTSWWTWCLLIVAAFPLAALITPLFDPHTTAVALLYNGLLTLLLAGACMKLGRCGINAFFILFSATTVALLVDVAMGAPLIRWSVLGYDVIGGARFYGIGNEYSGVLLTSAIMAIGIMLHRWPGRRTWMAAFFILATTAVITGSPGWGANNGAAAAAVAGFAFTLFFISGVPLNWHRVLMVLILLIGAGTAAVAVDLLTRPADPSHLGQLARLVAVQGLQPVFTIAGRKLAMNWKLLKYTIWTKVLVISLLMTLALLARPIPRMKQFMHKGETLLAATQGALLTTMFLLCFNDSGVVAAATAMIPVTTCLLYWTTCTLVTTSQVAGNKNQHMQDVHPEKYR